MCVCVCECAMCLNVYTHVCDDSTSCAMVACVTHVLSQNHTMRHLERDVMCACRVCYIAVSPKSSCIASRLEIESAVLKLRAHPSRIAIYVLFCFLVFRGPPKNKSKTRRISVSVVVFLLALPRGEATPSSAAAKKPAARCGAHPSLSST